MNRLLGIILLCISFFSVMFWVLRAGVALKTKEHLNPFTAVLWGIGLVGLVFLGLKYSNLNPFFFFPIFSLAFLFGIFLQFFALEFKEKSLADRVIYVTVLAIVTILTALFIQSFVRYLILKGLIQWKW